MKRETIRTLFLHAALICSIVTMTAGILDWYNPYMNFSGQVRPLSFLETGALLLLAATGERRRKYD